MDIYLELTQHRFREYLNPQCNKFFSSLYEKLVPCSGQYGGPSSNCRIGKFRRAFRCQTSQSTPSSKDSYGTDVFMGTVTINLPDEHCEYE